MFSILENEGILKFASVCYKNQEICNKAVDNYAHISQFVPDYYKTPKMYNKIVDTFPSALKVSSEYCKFQKKLTKKHLVLLLIDIRLKKHVIMLCPKKRLC